MVKRVILAGQNGEEFEESGDAMEEDFPGTKDFLGNRNQCPDWEIVCPPLNSLL